MQSQYNTLKARIEKVTAWDKEADDILQEIGIDYEIQILKTSERGTIQGWVYINTSPAKHVDLKYSSQSEKLEAFKKALLWLLDNSNIKDIVGQEAQVKIEGEDYKVKVLEKL